MVKDLSASLGNARAPELGYPTTNIRKDERDCKIEDEHALSRNFNPPICRDRR